jgi:hypothetical protein
MKPMRVIAVGVDVSKGYSDVKFVNDAKTVLLESGTFDDTTEGHGQLRERFLFLLKKNAGVQFIVGLESSGGIGTELAEVFPRPKNKLSCRSSFAQSIGS